MSHNFDPKVTPSTLCHAKMDFLPTLLYRVSPINYSPSPLLVWCHLLYDHTLWLPFNVKKYLCLYCLPVSLGAPDWRGTILSVIERTCFVPVINIVTNITVPSMFFQANQSVNTFMNGPLISLFLFSRTIFFRIWFITC